MLTSIGRQYAVPSRRLMFAMRRTMASPEVDFTLDNIVKVHFPDSSTCCGAWSRCVGRLAPTN
jgi:hypothetical protein